MNNMDVKFGDIVKIKGSDDEYLVTHIYRYDKDVVEIRNDYSDKINVNKCIIIEVKRPGQYKIIYEVKE